MNIFAKQCKQCGGLNIETITFTPDLRIDVCNDCKYKDFRR